MAKKKGDGGSRQPAVRVYTARKRSNSSTLWLHRQLNDPYVQRAKREGYRSRAAFKLIELDEKFHFLKSGLKVIDLGAAPGGWAQVAVKKCGVGNVVGIDLLAMDKIEGVILLKGDFLDPQTPALLEKYFSQGADLVLSDMAPNTTGHGPTDHIRIIAIVEASAEFALSVLRPGGVFVAKVWQGGTETELLARLKQHFTVVKHAKPKASRQDSAETYLVAMGFRK